MRLDSIMIEKIIEKHNNFSGVVFAMEKGKTVFESGFGYANKSELIANTIDTRFGIASGCKLFTSIAICQLVEKGIISFDTYLKDCVDIDFSNFNPNITVHHLLTHSSGIPDYFDEEIMNDFSELWKDRPMYNIRQPKDFLSMFQNRNMEFGPGEKFKYNNAGFIVLGLIVEKNTGMEFTEYVQKNIFEPCGMIHSGYFPLDQLPKGTAYGYIKDKLGNWKTNIYSLPIIGGPDGGAFTTAKNILELWKGIFDYRILSKKVTDKMLKPHIQVNGNFYYGYGMWIIKEGEDIFKYYIMGEDPGVSMMSSIYPKRDINVTVIGNTEFGTWDIAREIQDLIK
ncbi:serine hydrolase domain-containing protein [Maledivibacter halophilus]|uniref:CubicO group peptidase, beta-lactamase class C family n=1 Tax=Maledivibacter halophilus TaxID=36842 RepID=A0A1T5JBG5_9FIRM|nr:serine hydrolase [Maledivibacter halophilus]SKC48598.1 CubicO group peptidase, beta-lactamase class C family [Maledivibacter halophilus]